MSAKNSGSLVAEQTLQVILLFQKHKKLTLSEIAKTLDMSTTAAHRIVSTLKDTGFLIRDESKRYMLGSVFLKLAQMVEPNLRNVALPLMKQLSEETHGSIYLSISQNPSHYVFIEGVESPHPLKWSVDFGNPASTYAGSAGKTHLAFHDESKWLEEMEENELTAYTENTLIDKQELLDELGMIRKQGYSISKSERYHGVIGISVPVNDPSQQNASTVLSIFIPEYRFEEDKLDRYVSSLMVYAQRIVAQL